MMKTVKIEKKVEIGRLYHLSLLSKIGYTLALVIIGPPIMAGVLFLVSIFMAAACLFMVVLSPPALVFAIYQEIWTPPIKDEPIPQGYCSEMEAPERPND